MTIHATTKYFISTLNNMFPKFIKYISVALVAVVIPFKSFAMSDGSSSGLPEILRYHGMGNLLSSGFLTNEDGSCTYISFDTLSAVPDTADTKPFKVKLPEAPKAYWLEKDALYCYIGDSIYVQIESRDLKPEEKTGMNMIDPSDANSYIYNICPSDYLEGLNPKIYECFYKVVYDYYRMTEKIFSKLIEAEEKPDKKVNFTLSTPVAQFCFLHVPAQRIRDCMHIAGSFERIERCNFRNQRTD